MAIFRAEKRDISWVEDTLTCGHEHSLFAFIFAYYSLFDVWYFLHYNFSLECKLSTQGESRNIKESGKMGWQKNLSDNKTNKWKIRTKDGDVNW